MTTLKLKRIDTDNYEAMVRPQGVSSEPFLLTIERRVRNPDEWIVTSDVERSFDTLKQARDYASTFFENVEQPKLTTLTFTEDERAILYQALLEYGARMRREAQEEKRRTHDANAEWAVKLHEQSDKASALRDRILKPEKIDR